MLFNRVNDLRKEKLYNQAILIVLEACCNGVYQNYTLHTGPGLKKVDALVNGDALHYVLAIAGNILYINQVEESRSRDERRIEFPRELSSLEATIAKNGLPVAFVGSEEGDVWQVTITDHETNTITITKKGAAHNPIRSFTINGDGLIYTPLGDPSLHLYNLSRKNKSLLKKHNYKNAVHIKALSFGKKDYYALGYTDQEHTVPLLCLFDRDENLVWGVKEIEGSLRALHTFHNEEGEIIILAGTEKSFLYAIDARGKVQWKFKTDGAVNCMEVSYRPESKEPYVFIGSEGGTLYLLDFRGALKWKNVFTSAIKDCALVTISASRYPHLIVGLADNTIRSFSRSPAQTLAPLFSELVSDVLKHENCSEESLIDRLAQSDYQSIRDFAEIRGMGFGNDLALLILQCTHLGRKLDEIIELIMPHQPSAHSLARLAEFRLTYEQKNSSYDIKLRKRFEYLYQRGDMHDALSTGCQLAYQSSDIQWITHLPSPVDQVMALDTNRFIALSEKTVMLVDRLMPGRDARLTLPANIVACFPGGKLGSSDHDPTFTILTRDLRLHHFTLPLRETETITLQAQGRIKGEIRNTSVSRYGDLLCFSTNENICYIFNLSSRKAEIIARFKTEYHVTVTAFSSQGSRIHIVLGTREGKILLYALTKGGTGRQKGVEFFWSADIEGMPESMAAAGNPQGETLLIIGTSTGSTRAFDFEGNLLWEFRTITDRLQPGRAVKTIIPVKDQTHPLLYIFLLAGSYLYVVSGEGKLFKMFSLPESALCLDRAAANEVEGQSFLLLFTSGKLIQVTYYLKNPLSPALLSLYRSLIPPQGEEQWLSELLRSENPALQAFAFQQATQRITAYASIKEAILASLTHLKQKEGILRRAMVMSLEPLLKKNWDATLLLNTIDCEDLYQFAGLMSILHKVGTSSTSNAKRVVTFLKTIYAITKTDAHHIAILQLMEELLKDDPPRLAHFLFDITPFENSPWVSQEIGIILGRTLGDSYAENFNLLTRCFYVSSIQELKALSKEIKDNLPLYERKFTVKGVKALQLFSAIDWTAKERMEDPFSNELERLKDLLNKQSYAIATALFHKWERILKKVRTEVIALSDLSVMAWHKVERLNSQVRHSIVEGCFSGLESFSLMLKDSFGDRDITKGIMSSIKQLPMVRETLTDYFDGSIDGDVRLKDVFFSEYKTIFKELDEIEILCAHFEEKFHHTAFRNRFSAAIPEKTRTIQRESLARIDLAVKRLKTDVRALLENLIEHNPVKEALRDASIAVHMNLSPLDNAHFKVLGREHQLFNAFYEIITNILHHAFKALKDNRDKNITITGECYAKGNLYLKLTIADNGVGMTPHELARMRDISFQRGRTGDGVERVIQLIEENRGTVHYRSRKGKGTSVIITLPLKIREEKDHP